MELFLQIDVIRNEKSVLGCTHQLLNSVSIFRVVTFWWRVIDIYAGSFYAIYTILRSLRYENND